jgi:hypothetical protein
MQIKLTCSLCSGEVVYEAKGPEDRAAKDKAHAKLHKEGCAWAKSDERLSWMAEHGAPVESEVLS